MASKQKYLTHGTNDAKLDADPETLHTSDDAWRLARAGEPGAKGLKVWRITQAKVQELTGSKDIGTFYTGDSYLVLKAHFGGGSPRPMIRADVHFWLGKCSTSEEYASAARESHKLTQYLQTEHEGLAVDLHREWQGAESDRFVDYFQPCLIIEKGGYKQEKGGPMKLYHVKYDGHRATAMEKERSQEIVLGNPDKVFVLNTGHQGSELIQFNGIDMEAQDEIKPSRLFIGGMGGARLMCKLKEKSSFKHSYVVDNVKEFINKLGVNVEYTQGNHISHLIVGKPCRSAKESLWEVKVDEVGMKPHFDELFEGIDVKKENVDSADPANSSDPQRINLLIDLRTHVYIRVVDEKQRLRCWRIAHNFLKSLGFPEVPITVVTKGKGVNEERLNDAMLLTNA